MYGGFSHVTKHHGESMVSECWFVMVDNDAVIDDMGLDGGA